MGIAHRRAIAVSAAFISIAMVLTFQNCAPAKITSASVDLNSSDPTASTVGTKVNLSSLMSAEMESTGNILYPATDVVREARYAIGQPVIENLVVSRNDFSRIEWIHSASSIVLSNGTVFSPQKFSSELLGLVLVYGYRNTTPYFLGQVIFGNRTATTLNATSVGAVTVNSKPVTSDSVNEAFLVDVDAPNVDVASIQFNVQPLNQVVTSQRAFLITKKRSENWTVTVVLKDSLNQAFTKQLSFPATATVPTTTTTLPVATTTTTTTTTTTLAPLVLTVAPTVSNLASTTATINWSLNRVATGQVQYGLTTAYGSLSAPENSFNYSSHSQNLFNLTPGSLYHYRVVSKDASGQQVMSADQTFTTAPAATTTTTTTTTMPAPLPDLVVTSITWSPAVISERTLVTFYATIKNIGTGAVAAGSNLGIGFSVDGSPVVWSGNTMSLAPGASVTLAANGSDLGNFSTWMAKAGNHSVLAWVDDVNRIPESDDTNNKLNATIVVQAAPVQHIRTRVNNVSYIDAYASTNGIPMQIWTPYTSPTQDFQYTAANELRVQGKCLTSAATSGSAVTINDCTGAANQQWTYNSSTGEIKNSNGLCVDLTNSNVTNGTQVLAFTCNAGTNQKWDFVP